MVLRSRGIFTRAFSGLFMSIINFCMDINYLKDAIHNVRFVFVTGNYFDFIFYLTRCPCKRYSFT